MKKLLPFLLILTLVLSACSNECQDLLDSVNSARTSFQNNPTISSCNAFQSAMMAYMNSSCQGGSGVNYDAVFQAEIDGLNCDTLPVGVPTCANGVQDPGETGVDCGGVCPPCNSSNLFIAFTLDGTAYNWSSFATTGGSSCCSSGFGSSTAAAENSTYLSINVPSGSIDLDTMQSLVNQNLNFNEAGTSAYADLIFDVNGVGYDSRYGFNTANTSNFVVTSASLLNSQVIFGDTIENYLLEGTFNTKVTGGGDTLDITGGTFRLVFGNL